MLQCNAPSSKVNIWQGDASLELRWLEYYIKLAISCESLCGTPLSPGDRKIKNNLNKNRRKYIQTPDQIYLKTRKTPVKKKSNES